MKRRLAAVIALLCVSVMSLAAVRQQPSTSPVTRALEDELKRAMDVLGSKGDPAPYFISYVVNEVRSVEIDTSFGALRTSQSDHSRFLDVEVRVGDYQLDNTHQIRGQRGLSSGPLFSYPTLMPLDDDLDGLKSVIWLETDRKYKAAVERLIQVKANRAI